MLQKRFRTILFFFARTLLSLTWWEMILPHLGFRRLAEKGRTRRYLESAHRYRLLAVKMGGVLIKVGQFLSVRVDMLPPEVTEELSGLQDQVPPEDFTSIRQLAEEELGGPLEEVFSSFEEEPLASASLGQVHRAELFSKDALQEGERSITRVVVKIQRPEIEEIIRVDLSAFRVVSGWLQRYKLIRKRVDLPALMEEFSSILHQEIDYLQEGNNAQLFSEIYRDRPGIRVPSVVWEKTTRRVLTLEDVYAIKITNYSEIAAAGVDLREVARRLFTSYMEQIFDKEYFHADPHPGNLFVIPPEESPGGRWQLAFVDFGMVGHVPPTAREGLREAVIAVGTGDASRLVKAYQKLGFLLPTVDLELLERAEAKVLERVWGKSMTEIGQIDHKEMMQIGLEFRDLMYDMPFQIPQDLLLLGRTIVILSGMCTGLDPAFNLWDSLRPYAERLVRSELTGNWDLWWQEIALLLKSLASLPRRLDGVLGQMERGELEVRAAGLDSRLAGVERNLRQMSAAVVFFALVTGGAQLLVAGLNLPGYILLGAALIPLLLIIFR
jgi:predicted unusual protein kinase regulating ubiquinone biosynthesis (AarF/ABC1/UbiB family)